MESERVAFFHRIRHRIRVGRSSAHLVEFPIVEICKPNKCATSNSDGFWNRAINIGAFRTAQENQP